MSEAPTEKVLITTEFLVAAGVPSSISMSLNFSIDPMLSAGWTTE